MRTHHWLTAFMSGVVLLFGSWKVQAQAPPMGAAGYGGYTPVGYQGMPQGYNPYPTISPYDHVWDETYNDNGVWMRNIHNNTDYSHYFGMQALIGRFAKPKNEFIGHRRVNTNDMFFLDGDRALDNDDDGGQAVNPDALAFDNERGPWSRRGVGSTVGAAFPSSWGMELRYGISTPDGQTFELTGFGLSEARLDHTEGTPIQRTGNPRDGDPQLIIYRSGDPVDLGSDQGGPNRVTTDVVDLDEITTYNPGIPLNDGTTFGTVMRLDHYFKATVDSTAWGAAATWIHDSSYEWGGLNFRPLVGARYLGQQEQFKVIGHDSGLDYEIEFDITEPLYGFIDGATIIERLPIRMHVESNVLSNLGGAELGLRYELPGKNLSFFGETRVGLLGGADRINVKSKGLGQPYPINPPPDDDPGTAANPGYDPDLETSHTASHAYVTPILVQSLQTRSNVLQYVPLVNRVPIFRDAEFTAGYQILVAFQMARATNSIVWQSSNGAPFLPNRALIPEARVDRQTWFVQAFNLGVEWEF